MSRPSLNIRFQTRAHPIPKSIRVDPIVRSLSTGERSAAMQFEHPSDDERVFFTLPRKLIELLEAKFGREHFDRHSWELERRLSVDGAPQADLVGYMGGVPIFFPYLSKPVLNELSEDERRYLGMTDEAAEVIAALVSPRLERIHIPARGYVGWLLTNSQFLTEHDQLLEKWRGHIFHHGLPGSSYFNERHHPLVQGPGNPAAPADFLADFSSFYSRWRLSYLSAPYLPSPAVPQVPAPMPSRNSPITGATLFLPDTFPVPSRDELRDMMEEALRGGKRTEHLAEWHDLVRSDNKAKTSISRFGRLFILQHFWSVLNHRHREAFHRNEGALKLVMARYHSGDDFSEDDATIHKDLLFINERLGAGWHLNEESQSEA